MTSETIQKSRTGQGAQSTPPASSGQAIPQKTDDTCKPRAVTTTLTYPDTVYGVRRLTIDYPALFTALHSLPDPEPTAIQNTLAAADLIRVADGSSVDFGCASTVNDPDADFVQQAVSIPDEVFSTAHDLIGQPYDRKDRPNCKSNTGAELARAVLEDHVISCGFFDHLFSLLKDSPPARDTKAGKEIL